jgi:hypothetical protein
MKINFRPKIQNIYLYLYTILILLNIAALIAMFMFMNKYVFNAITIDRSTLISEKNVLTGDVDMVKFDNVFSKIINKKNKNDVSTITNIFK